MITRIKNEVAPCNQESIIIIDDALQQGQVNTIHNQLFNLDFPWHFTNDTTYNNPNHCQQRPGLLHWFVKDGRGSNYDHLIRPIIEAGAHALNLKEVDVTQARSFLQFPMNPQFVGNGIDSPHLDAYEPHWVFLYYVKDCDGDTVLYENKYSGGEPPYFHELKEAARITPKAGTLVIFDGMHWHTAEQPKNGVRCIININIQK